MKATKLGIAGRLRTERHHVLVVDDDLKHNEMLAWRLRLDGLIVTTAQNGDECLNCVSQQNIDLVLLDLHLGNQSGLALLSAIRDIKPASALPVILVTGECASETMIVALQDGANDYVTKPIDLNVVLARVRALLALKTENEQLRWRALYDSLTGLPNRATLIDRLNLAFARSQRSGDLLALLLLDLDAFKDVNDHYGHVAGDKVLVTIAKRLQDSLRNSDSVGRLGGDEFLVIAEGLNEERDADIVISRIQRAIGDPIDIDGDFVAVGASVGVHFWRAGDPTDLETLLGKVDSSMYSAKRARKSEKFHAVNRR